MSPAHLPKRGGGGGPGVLGKKKGGGGGGLGGGGGAQQHLVQLHSTSKQHIQLHSLGFIALFRVQGLEQHMHCNNSIHAPS